MSIDQKYTWADVRPTAEALGDEGGRACQMAEAAGLQPGRIYALVAGSRKRGVPFAIWFGDWHLGEPVTVATAEGVGPSSLR